MLCILHSYMAYELWSGWVWVGKCFFWYRPTRVVPDKGSLNGCVNVCVCTMWPNKIIIYFARSRRHLLTLLLGVCAVSVESWRRSFVVWLTIAFVDVSMSCLQYEHTHAHTHKQPFNGLWSGTKRVGWYQKKHSPTHTHESDILYQLPPFTAIHSIFFAQFTSLTVLLDDLFPGPLWSSSLSWTLYFILDPLLHIMKLWKCFYNFFTFQRLAYYT